MDNGTFINKVEASGIVAIDLIDYKSDLEIVSFDIKKLLFMEMIVREKEFKSSLSALDLTSYQGKAVAIECSVDTIIPSWVYMVLADSFTNASYVDFKETSSVMIDLWKSNLIKADLSFYMNKKVVVRARPEIPPELYIMATNILKPLVKTLMYGEIGMPKVISKK